MNKTYKKDGNVEEVLKIMAKVCSVTADEELIFEPYDNNKEMNRILSLRQHDRTLDKFVKSVETTVESFDTKANLVWYGSSILIHFPKQDFHDWDYYLSADKAERKKYDRLALDCVKAFTFIRGCRCDKDNIMETSLQRKYAHGNHDAFPTEFHKALQLYRK